MEALGASAPPGARPPWSVARLRRSAAARRSQRVRAQGRVVQSLLRCFDELSSHRGCQPTRLGRALGALLGADAPRQSNSWRTVVEPVTVESDVTFAPPTEMPSTVRSATSTVLASPVLPSSVEVLGLEQDVCMDVAPAAALVGLGAFALSCTTHMDVAPVAAGSEASREAQSASPAAQLGPVASAALALVQHEGPESVSKDMPKVIITVVVTSYILDHYAVDKEFKYRIRVTTPLRKLMDAHRKQSDIFGSQVPTLWLAGTQIASNDTAMSLGIIEMDVITARF